MRDKVGWSSWYIDVGGPVRMRLGTAHYLSTTPIQSVVKVNSILELFGFLY